jgi:N-acyl-D-aspartate/D-glutamate deacylase
VDVIVENGVIHQIGRNLDRAGATLIIDAQGRHVTPGLVDMHSHLGPASYPPPQACVRRLTDVRVRLCVCVCGGACAVVRVRVRVRRRVFVPGGRACHAGRE